LEDRRPCEDLIFINWGTFDVDGVLTELFRKSSWRATHWHRLATASPTEHLSTLDEVIDCAVDLCEKECVSSVILDGCPCLVSTKGACSQSCAPQDPNNVFHLTSLGKSTPARYTSCCPYSHIYLHVPSICVLKAVESSRGTAELAPATSCQLAYPTLHYDLNIPERAGGVCCSQLGCPAAGHC